MEIKTRTAISTLTADRAGPYCCMKYVPNMSTVRNRRAVLVRLRASDVRVASSVRSHITFSGSKIQYAKNEGEESLERAYAE